MVTILKLILSSRYQRFILHWHTQLLYVVHTSSSQSLLLLTNAIRMIQILKLQQEATIISLSSSEASREMLRNLVWVVWSLEKISCLKYGHLPVILPYFVIIPSWTTRLDLKHGKHWSCATNTNKPSNIWWKPKQFGPDYWVCTPLFHDRLDHQREFYSTRKQHQRASDVPSVLERQFK